MKSQDEALVKYQSILVDEAMSRARNWLRRRRVGLPSVKQRWQYDCALLAEEVKHLRRKIRTKESRAWTRA